MKYRELAAAIRKGAKVRPPVANTMEFFDDCGSCALGAAYEGMTGQVLPGHEWIQVIRYLRGLGYSQALMVSICDRFHARQTREQIADWLDSLEPRESDTDYTQRVLAEIVNGVETSVERKTNATAE